MKKVLAALLILVTLVVAGTALAASRKWTICGTCGGSGACNACGGSGQVPVGDDVMLTVYCKVCNGSGLCFVGGGQGGRYYP